MFDIFVMYSLVQVWLQILVCGTFPLCEVSSQLLKAKEKLKILKIIENQQLIKLKR